MALSYIIMLVVLEVSFNSLEHLSGLFLTFLNFLFIHLSITSTVVLANSLNYVASITRSNQF
ncbi:hypothetical protein G4B88_007631 [Cannabis sativa]|uniref:Uncharacterized protein n=1 Tax=Cannabis sativa TaxID=3483 RepID=A0A7J6HF00_CANSA|nr:hypothetical protein G4B88_007631 [Cannabis sativa]